MQIANTAFGTALARLLALFANCKLPELANFTLLAGNLTALNKVHPDLQPATPKVRPINVGSMLQKCGIRTMTSKPSFQKALSTMPQQYGLAKAGPEIVAHALRQEYLRGAPIFGGDAIQAFQLLDREIMLAEAAVRWPQAVNLVNMVYGLPSLALYSYRGGDGILHLRYNFSEQGARMGCVLGSALYDFGIAPLHEKAQKEFSDFTLRALTDDLLGSAPPPQSDLEWQAFYRRYSLYLRFLEVEGKPMGYKLHPDKLFLLLPPNAPDIDPSTRQELPPNLEVTRTGRKMAGTFIGTDQYIEGELCKVALEVTEKLRKLEAMGRLQPQIALRLVTNAIIPSFNYLCRVTPPSLMSNAAETIDLVTQATRLAILSDPHTGPGSAEEGRCTRAHTVASFPCRDGGLAQTPIRVVAAPAYLSSLATAVSFNSFVRHHLPVLDQYITSAHATTRSPRQPPSNGQI